MRIAGRQLLVQCDLARARIEFNRAADFQQDAVARFEKEVNNAQTAANNEWSKKGWNTQIAASATTSVRKEQEEILRRSALHRSPIHS